MGNESAAAPGAVVPVKKKKKLRPGSPEAMALEARQERRALFANQAKQDREDTYAAQRFSEITDGSSQTISKRGVRQRGTSDAQAGTMIREEIAAGKADPQTAPSASDPGFTGMGKPIALRTEGDRMARIASSPISASSKPLFSTRGAGGGDFSADQSAQYRQKALAMGASAKLPGSPNVVRTTATKPPSWDRGAIRGNAATMPRPGMGVDVNSPAGQTLKAGFEPQAQPMTPAAPKPAMPAASPAMPPRQPAAMRPDLTRVAPSAPKPLSSVMRKPAGLAAR